MLRAAEQTYAWHRLRCVRDLAVGRSASALRHARACHRLRPAAQSRRLIALSFLLSEQWREASEWAASIPRQPGE
jgi:hypothetical protein